MPLKIRFVQRAQKPLSEQFIDTGAIFTNQLMQILKFLSNFKITEKGAI